MTAHGLGKKEDELPQRAPIRGNPGEMAADLTIAEGNR